ncbi:MAG: fluoride efflux transporter CrcB [Chthoniobacterales bacterium]
MGSAANLLLVGAGGFLGAIGRYLLGGAVLHHAVASKFPWSTLAVNVLGCLLIGVLSGAAEKFDFIGQGARLFLFTGLLGGFTTFSAFGFETFLLLRRGELAVAALYATASVLVCLAAVWAGFRTVHMLAR